MNMLSDTEFDDILAGSGGSLGPRRLSSSSGGTFNESDDDFDPTSLLSEPLFDDAGEALSLDLNEIPGLPTDPTAVSTESGSESSRSRSKNSATNSRKNGSINLHLGGGGGMSHQPVYNDLPTSNQIHHQQPSHQMFDEQQMTSGPGAGNGGYVNNGVNNMDPMPSMMGHQEQQMNGGQMNNFQGMNAMQGAGGGQQMQNVNGQMMTNNQMQMATNDSYNMQQQMGGTSFNQQQQDMGGMGPDSIQNQQQAVNQRMMEVQQKIQQVQQQIQHVQLNGGGMATENKNPQIMTDQQQQFQRQQQQQGQVPLGGQGMPDGQGSFHGNSKNTIAGNNASGMNPQGRMMRSPSGRNRPNNPGFHRSPPGRSISMTSPAQKTSPFSNSFVMQQQQQRQNALQAMSQSLNAYQTQQMQNGQGGTAIDASTRSVPGDMGSMQAAMMQRATMQGNIGQPPFPNGSDDSSVGGNAGQQMMRNNSLPRQGQPMRNNSIGSSSMSGGPGMAGGGLDLAAMAQSLQAGAANGEGQTANVNEAMEKLCESMRRSAMSRSLVKQLSGKSLQRTHSGRSLSRSNSGRMAPVRSNSGRQLSRANSGKSLQRTHSGVQSMLVQGTAAANGGNAGMDNSISSINSMGSEMMSRRMSGMSISQNSRNRMTPTRGVFRHHSTTASMSNNRMSSLAAMQQTQIQQQQQTMQQQMDPNGSFQMMDPAMMQQQLQQQQQQQQQQQPNIMNNNMMPGGGF